MENTCRSININGMIREEGSGVIAYYNSKYIFSKLKRRIENEEANKKIIKIGKPIKVDLKPITLGEVE
jgi:hypothetical protein